MDVHVFSGVSGLRGSVWGTGKGRTLLNEPLCLSWLRPEVVSKGTWAQIKTRFISLSVDRGGFGR